MCFTVEIPDFVIPDNFFANALFECVDIYLNHELVSAKASNADYYLSDLFITRQIFNQPYSNNLIAGYYTDNNMDADEINSAYRDARRTNAVQITPGGQTYYQYQFYIQNKLSKFGI